MIIRCVRWCCFINAKLLNNTVVLYLLLYIENYPIESEAKPDSGIYIDQSPRNVTTFPGDKAEFNCVSSGNGLIFWFANGTDVHIFSAEHNASYFSRFRSDGENGENSTLIVVASEETNGTHYSCGVLDTSSNDIVNYSTPAILAVQGKPLPPSGLTVNIEKDSILHTYNIILLHWNRSLTLFDQDSEVSPLHHPTLYYIIYGYINESESETDMFYHNRTIHLKHTINIERLVGIDKCNLTEAYFTVSAKYNQVGEGHKSNPIEITKHGDVDTICSSLHSEEKEINFAVLGLLLSTTIYMAAMLIVVICIAVVYVQIKHKKRISMDPDPRELEKQTVHVTMNFNCAYESRNKAVIMNSNCAKTHKGAVQHKDKCDEVCMKANLAYSSCMNFN